jgi:hypothetical protein
MGATMAEHYFRANDDLAADLPARDDRPARQNWDIVDGGSGNTLPLARQWVGDYSWIVTVVPTTNAARNGLAQNPEGHTYDVSVVVFHKRPLPQDAISLMGSLGAAGAADAFRDTMGASERAVLAQIVSTGLNGGEILLTDLGDNPKESPFKGLRTGQWIMLCGPHPNSNVDISTTPPTGEPRFALNWYQVLTIDSVGTGISGFDPATQRVVAVRGPAWPWTPGSPAAAGLCVAICRGAVAVHTKTMRLESLHSSPVKFGGGGNPTNDPHGNWWQ